MSESPYNEMISQFPKDCTYFLKEHVGFPGSPVAKTELPMKRPGSIPGWGTRPHRPQESAHAETKVSDSGMIVEDPMCTAKT